MSDIIITAENLGKKYTIGHQRENGGYKSLRDELSQNVRGLFHKTSELLRGKDLIQGDSQEDFWALKDVSFEIKRGEAVGIIGRNGAGKSTLLKVLSRITEPSAGRVTIKGRVASLLEVGTGFHPELTGRENIYLNGAILGMARAEIKRKFDEIVAFAEVEKFLDTPVKRFSSGMYVRLAFAVAAHLEPEILVVDEVLAVGDAEFQKKSLGKMSDVAHEGRTVLFVSHNMGAIKSLCRSVIVLEKGHIKFSSEDVVGGVDLYLDKKNINRPSSTIDYRRYEDENFKLLDINLVNNSGEVLVNHNILRSSKVFVQIEFLLKNNDPAINLGYLLYGNKEECIFATYMRDGYEKDWPKLATGKNTIKVELPVHLINEGAYTIQFLVGLHNRKWIISPEDPVELFFVTEGPLVDTIFWYEKRMGLCAPLLMWQKQLPL